MGKNRFYIKQTKSIHQSTGRNVKRAKAKVVENYYYYYYYYEALLLLLLSLIKLYRVIL